MELIPIHIRLTEKQYEKLREESFETRISQAEIIRQALEKYWEVDKMTKAEKMWETLTEEEKELAENTLKDYAGSEGIVERMWELYEDGARGVGKSVEEYEKEISYGEYVQSMTEWDEYVEAEEQYLEDEKTLTTAEKIAAMLGDDGQIWEVGGKTLDDLCEDEDAIVYQDTKNELTRFLFPDGSAIVAGVSCWDIEGEEPFSWEGA